MSNANTKDAAATEGCAAVAGYAGDPPIPATVGDNLAMLCLQSQRYKKDDEYREAVDAVIAWVKAARRQNSTVLPQK